MADDGNLVISLKIEIPPVTKLEGEKNLRGWETTLIDHLTWHKVVRFIKESVPQPEDKAAYNR